MKTLRTGFLCLLFSLQVASSVRASSAAQNSNAVSPGEFIIDPPTLINLGFEWMIEGDDNRNAAVAVSYRKEGRIPVAASAASSPAAE